MKTNIGSNYTFYGAFVTDSTHSCDGLRCLVGWLELSSEWVRDAFGMPSENLRKLGRVGTRREDYGKGVPAAVRKRI